MIQPQYTVRRLRVSAKNILTKFAAGKRAWTNFELMPYFRLHKALKMAGIPSSITKFFGKKCNELTSLLVDHDRHFTEFARFLFSFSQICKLLVTEARRSALGIVRSASFDKFVDALVKRGEEETNVSYIRTEWESADLQSEADDYLLLGQAFSTFGALPARGEGRLLELRHQGAQFESEAGSLSEEAAKRDPSSWDYSGDIEESREEDKSDTTNTELLRIFDDL